MEVSALTHSSSVPALCGPSALLRLQSDEKLIALTRRGQHAAFETLCARYQSRLLAFCRHMLGSREDAEDVLQEVFASAFNAILADEREINVRPWLYRIARNRSLNHLRRASAIGMDSMDVHLSEHGLSTGDRVMRRESFRELIADVQELPETQRTALLLREIDALSYEQIAHAMETTVPSVKSLLVRARISLAEAAEARKLSCDEVRLELGEAAEGLAKLGNAARRHVRGCERCASFKKHLRENNRALAAIFPVAPLLLIKKVVLAKIGSTASAGGAHVAGGAGATVGAGAGATVGASAVAGAGATGGAGVAGGLLTAGAGAVATKAVAGLAAAAIVTAGAVAADHAVVVHHHKAPTHQVYAADTATAPAYVPQPVVAGEHPQPASISVHASTFVPRHALAAHRALRRVASATKTAKVLATAVTNKPNIPPAAAAPTVGVLPVAGTAPAAGTTPAVSQPPVVVKPSVPQPTGTQVTEETTQLPNTATGQTQPASASAPTTTTAAAGQAPGAGGPVTPAAGATTTPTTTGAAGATAQGGASTATPASGTTTTGVPVAPAAPTSATSGSTTAGSSTAPAKLSEAPTKTKPAHHSKGAPTVTHVRATPRQHVTRAGGTAAPHSRRHRAPASGAR